MNHKIFSAFLVILIIALTFFVKKNFLNKQATPQYQTATVEKGTLTIIVSASGQVSQANSATVETQASGVISKIYVANGQEVKTGDKIADIDLDLIGQQRASQALASYQSTQDSLYSLQSDMLTKWKTYMDLAQNATTDMRQLSSFVATSDDWLSTQAKYKNQQNLINSAWLSYQQTSPTIYAPIPGTVTGLSLQIGSVLVAQSNSSGTSTSQKIASVQTQASPTIQVNLSQIDTPKVKIGNRATLTFDAFPDKQSFSSNKTFTGKILSIDTIGAISSGVTTYPAVIKLDTLTPEIFSNMTAQANIITQIKDNILIVPTTAVQTQNGQATVRILQNGAAQTVDVTIGLSSATQTEIVSGLTEGQTIVTSIISTTPTGGASQTTSPFGGRGGGAAFRLGGG